MLTFQILDGGDVLTFTLGDLPVTIGSDPSCELRLASPGVAPRHARVEPIERSGGTAWRLLDLGGGTSVNGAAVADAVLSVGDRIEVGSAALVLGRRVLRQATAEDVIAEGLAQRAQLRSPRRPRLPWAMVAGAAAVLAVAGWAIFARPSPPRSLGSIAEWIERGELEEAERAIESLRRSWAGSDAARLALLEVVEAETAIEAYGAVINRVDNHDFHSERLRGLLNHSDCPAKQCSAHPKSLEGEAHG